MEDYTNPEIQEEENLENEELSFSDKIVGVFSEPVATFESIAKFKLKVTDWLFPLLIVAILAVSSQYILMTNPVIKQEIIDKQMEAVEKSINEAVESGRITQAQADQQREIVRNQMDSSNPVFMIIGIIGGIIGFAVFFFIIATFYFILAKFILKGDGSFTGAMIGTAMPYFITLVQIILIIIVSLATENLIRGFSIATLLDMDTKTITGFLMSRFEIFSIFGYTVTGIALAKLFNAESVKNYVIAVIGSWLVFSFIVFYLAKSIPFLANFI